MKMRKIMNRGGHAVLALVAAVAAAGCFGDSANPLNPSEATFAASLGVNLAAMTQTQTGLYYQDLAVGEGAAAAEGDSVSVRYTGWLRDGTQFDSSGNSTVTFRLSPEELIWGFYEGVLDMQEGGERKLVIPWQLAYGATSRPGIPAFSILVFDIELVSVIPAPPDEEDPD